jgi:hypothetical protein
MFTLIGTGSNAKDDEGVWGTIELGKGSHRTH